MAIEGESAMLVLTRDSRLWVYTLRKRAESSAIVPRKEFVQTSQVKQPRGSGRHSNVSNLEKGAPRGEGSRLLLVWD